MKKILIAFLAVYILVSAVKGVSGHFVRSESVTRATTCYTCHGDGVCAHCDGESFRDGRRCIVCNGTGKCHSCNGTGSLEVRELNDGDYIICTVCQGEGSCGACDGTGTVVFGRFKGKCSLCHGSGKCISCKGKGVTELRGF